MLVKTLIDKAKEKSHLSLGQMASRMGIAQSNLSNWKKGDNTPSPAHTAFLAKLAGVDPLVAIAEIEAEKKPTSVSLWAAIGVEIGGDERFRPFRVVKKYNKKASRSLAFLLPALSETSIHQLPALVPVVVHA